MARKNGRQLLAPRVGGIQLLEANWAAQQQAQQRDRVVRHATVERRHAQQLRQHARLEHGVCGLWVPRENHSRW